MWSEVVGGLLASVAHRDQGKAHRESGCGVKLQGDWLAFSGPDQRGSRSASRASGKERDEAKRGMVGLPHKVRFVCLGDGLCFRQKKEWNNFEGLAARGTNLDGST